MVDIDAAGGVATGGLIAGAIEKPTGKAGEHHPGTCSDCGEPTTGNFCANCGQPTHVHRSLLHLGEELLHGVMHFDARIWRTLPLLIGNPGRLTREWIQGKRTRYVSPLAIFLFTIFLMFFALSYAGGLVPTETRSVDERIASTETVVANLRTQLAEADANVAAGEPGAQGAQAGIRSGLTAAEGQLRALREAQAGEPRGDGLIPGSWQANMADMAHNGNIRIGLGDKKMQDKILHKLANPDLAVYKFQQTTYKFAFLLVPMSLPFVWLMFGWKRGFTWYDHGVFVLYSLTFMAILFMALGVLGRMSGWFAGLLGVVGTLAVPAHMFAQLKGTYGLSIFSALWRTALLLFFCLLVSTLFFVAIVALGLGA
ncbi:MAG: DUF3667 domain-containing protein [Alphaproteobacteria bacterium]|nr:DUF3667 domain-containing protein [Alphaproteobacteria bacterium]MBU2377701.1 DUF3667 domain-containing protein [Alphaproteobacteria bacterium]